MTALRVMLVHASDPVVDLRSPDTRAHLFGPFDSHEDAEAFDAEHPDDCFAATFPIAGPDVEDVDRWIALR